MEIKEHRYQRTFAWGKTLKRKTPKEKYGAKTTQGGIKGCESTNHSRYNTLYEHQKQWKKWKSKNRDMKEQCMRKTLKMKTP